MKRMSPLASSVLVTAAMAASTLHAAKEVPLIDADNPAQGWRFNPGAEFPGAKGGIAQDDTVEPQRKPCIRLDGDFTGGGGYVDVGRDVPDVEANTLTYWMKAPEGAQQMTVRLMDGAGRCHQLNLKTEPHGNWQQVILPITKYFDMKASGTPMELVAKYESWGNGQDGVWQQPLRGIFFLTGPTLYGEAKKGSVWFSGMKVLAAPPAPYKESFDAADTLPQGWAANGPQGAVAVAKDAPFDGANALRLQRLETQLNANVSATGAAFPAAPGAWNLGGAIRSALHSPDNSFNVTAAIEALDANGGVLERKALVEQTGTANWKPFSRLVD
ncbi:MAG: hypothetical protein FWF96_07575, partial [Kiritimatiellaeota bacterium]|nr:hypothetical protein [Kiritimatiellota bacterium]